MKFLDKMVLAGTVAADLEARAERDADALIARGDELNAKREKAFAVHRARMDASHDALDRLEHALDSMGNEPPQTGSDAGKAPSEEIMRVLPATPYDGTTNRQGS